MTGDQRGFYREVEHEYWAAGEGLDDEEAAALERSLDPAVPTLEGGCGGGRIVRALAKRGFGTLSGFDFSPEMIAAARARDPQGAFAFDVADATALPYPDSSFGQAVYLQQVLCLIEAAEGRRTAIAEMARVLRPGGVAVLSVLCLEGRRSPAQRAYLGWLRASRALRREPRPLQLMPRLRLRGRASAGALRDAGPYVWWYRAAEAERALIEAGLEVVEVASGKGSAAGITHANASGVLASAEVDQRLYFGVRKPD